MSHGDRHDYWSSRLHDLATKAGLPGAALGIWADGQETVAAHGVLSTATRVSTTPDSLFQVGSITKVWTATMIMQLAGEGRVSLDTTVAEVLPGLRLGAPDTSGEVTLRQLLTHTSGLDGDIFTDTGRGSDCLERYAEGLSQAARGFPPGAAYSYCNSGFCLLGRVIEVLDGREWDASLRARLVEPLGLTGTVTLPEEAILHRAAVGHREPPHQGEPVPVWALPRSMGPAGGVISTVHDVLSFARLHLAGGTTPGGTRLVGEAQVAAMQEPQFAIPGFAARNDSIGLAWRLGDWSGHRVFGHDGDTLGQQAYLLIAPESGVAACLLTNSYATGRLFQQLFTEIFQAFAGLSMPASPQPASGVEVDLRRHTGRYERVSLNVDVSVRDGQLRMVYATTGNLAELSDHEPEDLVLYPADSTGDTFVCRSFEEEPWTAVSFSHFSDGTPYLYASGRVTPKVS
ncbi:MAG TPA: serine hydrolase domain-containing protein [Streptosporangiaceae bacterium]|jgi:CubicO group peptidase (beta-lactamase class C family)